MVKILIYTPDELNHSSYVHSGLFELEKKQLITCSIKMRLKKDRGCLEIKDGKCIEKNLSQPKTSFYELIDNNCKHIRFATDLYDIGSKFSKVALDTCDFIFKRNFSNYYISQLPNHYQNKIYPLGMTFKVRSYPFINRRLIEYTSLISNLIENLKIDKLMFNRIFKVIKYHQSSINSFKNITKLNAYDDYSENTDNKIIYQKRFFPNELNPHAYEVHMQRLDFIKKLKESFGDEYFIGGLVPCPITKKNYPEYLTKLPVSHNEYINIMKKTKIVIYTRGLHNSIGWTLPEYLASGKAILAERFDTILPEPLINDKHVLFFDDIDDCIKKAKLLIKNENKINILCKNSRNYYQDNINPVQNIKRIVELMIDRKL